VAGYDSNYDNDSCNVFNSLSLANAEIERVHVFKLLGVYINRSLKWDDHVRSICNKAASRIYFLKQLKRSLVGPDDLFHFYATVQSCSLGLDISVSRRSRDVFFKHLGLVSAKCGKVSVWVSSRTESQTSRSRLGPQCLV